VLGSQERNPDPYPHPEGPSYKRRAGTPFPNHMAPLRLAGNLRRSAKVARHIVNFKIAKHREQITTLAGASPPEGRGASRRRCWCCTLFSFDASTNFRRFPWIPGEPQGGHGVWEGGRKGTGACDKLALCRKGTSTPGNLKHPPETHTICDATCA
jgi:hypothetical protein